MPRRRPALWAPTLVVALSLTAALAACGDDDDDTASTTPQTEASATETSPTTEAVAATTTTGAAAADETTTTGSPAAELTGDEADAAAAFAAVFDSSVPFADKAPHLEDAAALEPTHELYVVGAEQVGGIRLEPSAVTIDGDLATVTYDVLFGGQVAYEDLSAEISSVDGVWVVSRAGFCGFMTSAQTPCV